MAHACVESVSVSGFDQRHVIKVSAHSTSFVDFRRSVAAAFSLEPSSPFVLTTTDRRPLDAETFSAWLSGKHVSGAPRSLFVLRSASSRLGHVHRELIDYQPHWSTLESGKHHFGTLGQAVAEFVDNSVQSTARCKTRTIQVHLFASGARRPRVHAMMIWDNGKGMDRDGIRSFATYFEGQEERGLAPPVTPVASDHSSSSLPPALQCFISKFGVGAIEAGFFIARRMKVISKTRSSVDVREFAMSVDALRERSERNKRILRPEDRQSVYSDPIITRDGGDTSTLSAEEAASAGIRRLVMAENCGGDDDADDDDLSRSSTLVPQFTTILLTGLREQHVGALAVGKQLNSAPANAPATALSRSSKKDGFGCDIDAAQSELAHELAHIYYFHIHPQHYTQLLGYERTRGKGGGAASRSARSARSNAHDRSTGNGRGGGKPAVWRPEWNMHLDGMHHVSSDPKLDSAGSGSDAEEAEAEAAAARVAYAKAAANICLLVHHQPKYNPKQSSTTTDTVGDKRGTTTEAYLSACKRRKTGVDTSSAEADDLIDDEQTKTVCTLLRNVHTDLCSLTLSRAKARFVFDIELQNPDPNCNPDARILPVKAVMMYFPFDGTETRPRHSHSATIRRIHHGVGRAAGADESSGRSTRTADNEDDDITLSSWSDSSDTEASTAQTGSSAAYADAQVDRGVIVECYWQGRLVPDSKVFRLPFFPRHASAGGNSAGTNGTGKSSGSSTASGAGAASGMTRADRDALPAEWPLRVKGMLFFPWHMPISNNKLKLMVNPSLEHALCDETRTRFRDRNIGSNFREWLVQCHNRLDKEVIFSEYLPGVAPSGHTAFRQIAFSDASAATYCTGDRLKLVSNDRVYGIVRHFLAPGDHSISRRWIGGQGLVVVAQQPEEVYGKNSLRVLSLKRIDHDVGIVDERAWVRYVRERSAMLPASVIVNGVAGCKKRSSAVSGLNDKDASERSDADECDDDDVSKCTAATDGDGVRRWRGRKCVPKHITIGASEPLTLDVTVLNGNNKAISKHPNSSANQYLSVTMTLTGPEKLSFTSTKPTRGTTYGFKPLRLSKAGQYELTFSVTHTHRANTRAAAAARRKGAKAAQLEVIAAAAKAAAYKALSKSHSFEGDDNHDGASTADEEIECAVWRTCITVHSSPPVRFQIADGVDGRALALGATWPHLKLVFFDQHGNATLPPNGVHVTIDDCTSEIVVRNKRRKIGALSSSQRVHIDTADPMSTSQLLEVQQAQDVEGEALVMGLETDAYHVTDAESGLVLSGLRAEPSVVAFLHNGNKSITETVRSKSSHKMQIAERDVAFRLRVAEIPQHEEKFHVQLRPGVAGELKLLSVAGAQDNDSAEGAACISNHKGDVVNEADNAVPVNKSEAEDSSLVCVRVENGSCVPDMVVAVFDEYGNRAAPMPGEEWTFRVESNDVAEGRAAELGALCLGEEECTDTHELSVNSAGVGVIRELRTFVNISAGITRDDSASKGKDQGEAQQGKKKKRMYTQASLMKELCSGMRRQLTCYLEGDAMHKQGTACYCDIGLVLLASTRPSRVAIWQDGRPLDVYQASIEGDCSGGGSICLIEAEAGSTLTDLELRIFDEGGRHLDHLLQSKEHGGSYEIAFSGARCGITASWQRGFEKLGNLPILSPLRVPMPNDNSTMGTIVSHGAGQQDGGNKDNSHDNVSCVRSLTTPGEHAFVVSLKFAKKFCTPLEVSFIVRPVAGPPNMWVFKSRSLAERAKEAISSNRAKRKGKGKVKSTASGKANNNTANNIESEVSNELSATDGVCIIKCGAAGAFASALPGVFIADCNGVRCSHASLGTQAVECDGDDPGMLVPIISVSGARFDPPFERWAEDMYKATADSNDCSYFAFPDTVALIGKPGVPVVVSVASANQATAPTKRTEVHETESEAENSVAMSKHLRRAMQNVQLQPGPPVLIEISCPSLKIEAGVPMAQVPSCCTISGLVASLLDAGGNPASPDDVLETCPKLALSIQSHGGGKPLAIQDPDAGSAQCFFPSVCFRATKKEHSLKVAAPKGSGLQATIVKLQPRNINRVIKLAARLLPTASVDKILGSQEKASEDCGSHDYLVRRDAIDADENECGAYELCAAREARFPSLLVYLRTEDGVPLDATTAKDAVSVSLRLTRARAGAADATGAKELDARLIYGVPICVQAEAALFYDIASDVVRPGQDTIGEAGASPSSGNAGLLSAFLFHTVQHDCGDNHDDAAGPTQAEVATTKSQAMRVAGAYSLSVQYIEPRVAMCELLGGDAGKAIKSNVVNFKVSPGPGYQLCLLKHSDNSVVAQLSALCASNAIDDAESRILLQNATIAIIDAAGNRTDDVPEGTAIRVRITRADAGAAGVSLDVEDSLPSLENGNERGEIVRRIAAGGKASFGTLALRPGEGSREGEYVLRLEAVTATTVSDSDKDASDTGALQVMTKPPIDLQPMYQKFSFTTDSGRSEDIRRLSRKADELRSTVDIIEQRTTEAQAAHDAVQADVAAQLQQLPDKVLRPDVEVTVAAADDALERVRSKRTRIMCKFSEARPAKVGRGDMPAQLAALALKRDRPMVAQLGYVSNERTAMLLSWAIGMAKMEAVLVESAASQQQAHTLGASAYAMETISRFYVPQKGKKRERNATERHQRKLNLRLPLGPAKGDAAGADCNTASDAEMLTTAANPRHAVNMIELPPADEDLRDTLFHSLFGHTIVCKSRDTALKYRAACMRKRVSCPRIITEDGHMIDSTGFLGKNNKLRMSEAKALPFVFGEMPALLRPEVRKIDIIIERLEALRVKLVDFDAAQQRLSEAKDAEKQAEQQRQERRDVERELKQLKSKRTPLAQRQ